MGLGEGDRIQDEMATTPQAEARENKARLSGNDASMIGVRTGVLTASWNTPEFENSDM
jgi:hypothetical protein